jgi:hypothetical protein
VTIEINELQDEFYKNNSEIETVARDSIAEAVESCPLSASMMVPWD